MILAELFLAWRQREISNPSSMPSVVMKLGGKLGGEVFVGAGVTFVGTDGLVERIVRGGED